MFPEKVERELLKKAPTTYTRYKSVVSRFLGRCGLKERYSPEEVNDFFGNLGGKDDHYLAFCRAALAWLSRAMGMDIPLPDRFKIDDARAVKRRRELTLSHDEVKRLVEHAKSADPLTCSALALSTTYGMRRVEISRVEPGDIDTESGLIVIRTAKSGRARELPIPEEIKPYLGWSSDFGSESELSSLFVDSCGRAGVGYRKGMGFHAIRRSLLSALRRVRIEPEYAGLWPLALQSFFGWSGSGMVDLYSSGISDWDSSRLVLKHHPFLEFWRR